MYVCVLSINYVFSILWPSSPGHAARPVASCHRRPSPRATSCARGHADGPPRRSLASTRRLLGGFRAGKGWKTVQKLVKRCENWWKNSGCSMKHFS